MFVILCLLLNRHYDIMRVAQNALLHFEEVSDAASTMVVVRDAFNFRVDELVGMCFVEIRPKRHGIETFSLGSGLFTQRRLVVDVELADFACGMVSPGL